MKLANRLCFLLIALFIPVPLSAATASSVSQYGVTWTFNTGYEVGQFVNGDWWVVGPVTITSITPSFDGLHNGWESNPTPDYVQGLEAFTYGGGWDASLVPSLPYDAVAGESLLKGVSIPTGTTMIETCRGDCLSTASILTVVSTSPSATDFRPPYTGTTKPLYSTDDLHTELLPTLTPVGSPPTIQSIVDRYVKVQLNHEMGAMGRALRPQDHMNDYQPENTETYNDAIMRMMLDDSVTTKMPALVQLVQYGIDTGYSILNGQTFPAGGGHQPAHRIVAAFAATMLDITEIKTELNTATYLHEDEYLYNSSGGKGLWGEVAAEHGYWEYIMDLGGSRSQRDPYGYIDGGKCGMEYQMLTVQAHKGEILATVLMPSLQGAWRPAGWAIVKNYVERWVESGVEAQPDPCAPFDGVVGNYGQTYGADSNNPGMCILDSDLDYYNGPTDFACQTGKECGRYPEKLNTEIDGGLYASSFVRDMWGEYYESTNEATISNGLCSSASGLGISLGYTGVGSIIKPDPDSANDLSLKFASGFEGGTLINDRTIAIGTANWRIEGDDGAYNWVDDIVALDESKDGFYGGGLYGNYDQTFAVDGAGWAEITADPEDANNQVMKISAPNPVWNDSGGYYGSARVSSAITFNNVDSGLGLFSEGKVKYRMRLSGFDGLATMISGVDWLVIGELFEMSSGSCQTSRVSFSIHKDAGVGEQPYFALDGQSMVNCSSPGPYEWQEENKDIAIPIDEWFDLEIYYLKGNATTGHVVIAIETDSGGKQTLFNVTNYTESATNPDGYVSDWQMFKLYGDGGMVQAMKDNGTPLQIFYDDFEYYSTE